MSEQNETFYRLFDSAIKTNQLAYDSTWANGTGYYDGAASGVTAPKLDAGQVAACITPMPNNRKIILIGLPSNQGNLVFFERYTGGASGVVVSNKPSGNHLPQEIRDATNSRIGDRDLQDVCDWVATLINIRSRTDADEMIMLLNPWAVV